MVALLVVLTLIAFVLADGIVQFVQARRREASSAADSRPEVFPLDELTLPGGLFLAPGHTWVALREDGRMRIGIDSLITGLTGKFSSFELPQAGNPVRKGDGIFSVLFGDRRLSFVSPVAGTVTRVNTEASEEPPIISSSPYRHWICELEPVEVQNELRAMRIGKAALEWLQSELASMRSFLVDSRSDGLVAAPAMPDGGSLAAGALKVVEDATLAEFEARFLKV